MTHTARILWKWKNILFNSMEFSMEKNQFYFRLLTRKQTKEIRTKTTIDVKPEFGIILEPVFILDLKWKFYSLQFWSKILIYAEWPGPHNKLAPKSMPNTNLYSNQIYPQTQTKSWLSLNNHWKSVRAKDRNKAWIKTMADNGWALFINEVQNNVALNNNITIIRNI